MPYNLEIPGQVSEYQLRAIEAVASLVPQNGTVVEVGSLFGRSSWAWAKSVHPSVTVACIDPWVGNEGVRMIERAHGVVYGFNQFRANTSDCANIQPWQGFSPRDFSSWSGAIDLYYEDAVHTNPTLEQNLDFWTSRLTPSGIVCGDDFRPRFPDVQAGARRVAAALGRRLVITDFFWCALPSETQLKGSEAVALKLTAIDSEYRASKVSIGPLLTLEATQAPVRTRRGDTLTVVTRLVNEGLEAWPAEPLEPIRVRFRLSSITRKSHSDWRQQTLSTLRLEADIPAPIEWSVETGALESGLYGAEFAVSVGNSSLAHVLDGPVAPGALLEITSD